MENRDRSILFIDDNYGEFLDTLKPQAEYKGYNLVPSETAEEGIQLLDSYISSIDAVILDHVFPIDKMQGLDALKLIKKKYKYLPVIMLTGSESAEDIGTVVQCMKAGAYNYVGKRHLNPEYLFQLLDNAINQSRLTRYISESVNGHQDVLHLVTVIKDYSIGRFNKRVLFGFELNSVVRPNDESDEKIFRAKALEWHYNLLTTLSISYNESIQLNLKFYPLGGHTRCRVIFSLFAENEAELNIWLASIKKDIAGLFRNHNSSKINPYLFGIITDEDILEQAIQFEPHDDYEYIEFYREPLIVQNNKTLGFTIPSGSSGDEGSTVIFPQQKTLVLDKTLYTALLSYPTVEIDVQLIPCRLTFEEKQLLQNVIRTKSLTTTEGSAISDQQNYEYINNFIGTKTKFLISVMLKCPRNLQQNAYLKNAIINYFYGGVQVLSTNEQQPLKRYRINNGSSNRLPFMYSLEESLQAFRLPLPDCSFNEGLESQPLSFSYIPENISCEGILVGKKKTVTRDIPIKISESSLSRHLYIMGQTGTGKSTMLKTMISDCIDKDSGFALIDPHGDLFEEIKKILPEEKKTKLLIIDTTDPTNSCKHNPLKYNEKDPRSKSLIINELVRIFHEYYDMKQAGGPMFEMFFKYGLLLVMDEQVRKTYPDTTLLDFVKVFFNDDYRNRLLKLCGNQNVIDFFITAHKMTGEQSFENFAPYITSKLIRLTEDSYLTPIITGNENNIDYRKLIDEGNILLVKMDKGRIGMDNVSLLGRMIISSISLAAMSRANQKKSDRIPFYLFIDEFQNFISSEIGSAMSEVRKYGLTLILANQTLGQLNSQTIEGLMGNVGSMVFFRPGINDYGIIKHYLEPEFKREDVLKLPNFNCIARLLIDNVPSDPFLFQNKYP